LRLEPWLKNNNFDVFRSSRYAGDGVRPILGLTFTQPVGTPNFKLPLLGGARWLLTNEIGGYECLAAPPTPDTYHQGNNYFALDFSPTNVKDGGGSYSGSIPILASAGGTVHSVGFSNSTGHYIILDHGNGFLTRYIHFNNPAARRNGTLLAAGNSVSQGDQIGIMGNIGAGAGVHLHMNFWHNGIFNGGSAVSTLTYVTMEGLLLKSFQTECQGGNRIRYYRSANTPTGS
jgi:peptidase M23-like protein